MPSTAPFGPSDALRPAVAPSSTAQPETGAPGPVAAPRVLEFELEDRSGLGTNAETLEAIPVPKPTAGYVPAGSYAEAVVLAGADASAGVQSQGDPRPVLPEIDRSGLRGGGRRDSGGDGSRGLHDHRPRPMETCRRRRSTCGFRTMACAGERPGTVIETPVSGFVAGAGKAGVRGAVVSREGALVQRAFLAGLFSGFGESATQAFRPQAVLAGGGTATVTNTGLGDIGRAGLGSGAGTAGREISDYLIRRAEQYQPVIQLAAGTPVTVVFLEGAWLDGRNLGETSE